MPETPTVLWFDDPACAEIAVAGGKGASLASMTQAGLPVPPGFAIPSDKLSRCVDADALRGHARNGDWEAAMRLVMETATVPDDVLVAYERLGGQVAVRSSASAEDSEAASYAGQQETYLEVEGAETVRQRVIDCWASFFSERALFYRGQKGSLDDLSMAVVVQKMVAAEKAGDPVAARNAYAAALKANPNHAHARYALNQVKINAASIAARGREHAAWRCACRAGTGAAGRPRGPAGDPLRQAAGHRMGDPWR